MVCASRMEIIVDNVEIASDAEQEGSCPFDILNFSQKTGTGERLPAYIYEIDCYPAVEIVNCRNRAKLWNGKAIAQCLPHAETARKTYHDLTDREHFRFGCQNDPVAIDGGAVTAQVNAAALGNSSYSGHIAPRLSTTCCQ